MQRCVAICESGGNPRKSLFTLSVHGYTPPPSLTHFLELLLHIVKTSTLIRSLAEVTPHLVPSTLSQRRAAQHYQLALVGHVWYFLRNGEAYSRSYHIVIMF